MDEIIKEFKSESHELVQHMLAILEEAEEDFTKVRSLDTFGQLVDRIMGGAKTIAATDPKLTTLEAIGKYSELCKAIGYKGSQISNNEQLYNVTVGVLLDATEMLDEMVNGLESGDEKSTEDFMTSHFLERLTWLASQFGDEYRASVAVDKKDDSKTMIGSQSEVDALIAHFSKG